MAKYCKKCGAQMLSDEAVCCLNCGAVQPAEIGEPEQESYSQNASQPQQNNFNPQQAQQDYFSSFSSGSSVPRSYRNDATTPLGWLGWSILCSILPIIGALIMMSLAKDESTKNYAKLMLVLYIIVIILYVILRFFVPLSFFV